MFEELKRVKIRGEAVQLADRMRQLKVKDISEGFGVYHMEFEEKEYDAKAEDASLDVLCEGCFRILDRLRELNREGVTTEQVHEFARWSQAKRKAAKRVLLFPALEVFCAESPLHDGKLQEIVPLLAMASGAEIGSKAYWFRETPALQWLVLKVALRDMEIKDEDYVDLAWMMLRAILALHNGYR